MGGWVGGWMDGFCNNKWIWTHRASWDVYWYHLFISSKSLSRYSTPSSPGKCTYIYSVPLRSIRQRGRLIRLPECRDPDTLTISQPATHAATSTQPGAIYEPILPDRRTQSCTDAFVNTITHIHPHMALKGMCPSPLPSPGLCLLS